MKNVLFLLFIMLLGMGAGSTAAAKDLPDGNHIAFSISGSGELGTLTVGREEILDFGDVTGTRLLFPDEAIAFLCGDITGNGKEDPLDNIDALHVGIEPHPTRPRALYLSTVKDGLGVKDGDIFRFEESGGIAPYLPESHFVDLVGAVDGNVDIDAFTMGTAGTYYFSFADNEESSLLSGSQPGVIADGDILIVDAGGSPGILYTEDQVSDMASLAASKTLKIGDVLGLAYDALNGALLFSVQSPSAYDATVFSDLEGGSLVPGFDETALGFSNAVEIDALSLVPSFRDMPSMTIEPRYPAQGDQVTLTLAGGASQGYFYLLLSGARTDMGGPYFAGGFGPMLLDTTHAYFLEYVTQLPYLMGYFNGTGDGTFDCTMPMDPVVTDIHIQAIDPLEWVYSHPITMEFNQ